MIQKIIDKLSTYERAKLEHSYRCGIPYYHEYEPGKYVGVYTDKFDQLTPVTTEGVWCIGTIK